ncbi:MAG: TatD family hydrolase [Coriobacteriia bacterium]|nr:TatD family hydrolase [Coriobacteriia bacterium]
MRISVGVHPHNARHFTPEVQAHLYDLMADPRVNAVGEIGLDYHYDLSPRDVQRDVFRTQLRMAKEAGLPVALHIREAHDEALEILHEEGFPEAGTLLHCCGLGPEELRPWIDAGCYIAYGGVVTFTNSDDAREGAKLVPLDRLLTETDAPYMAPVPLRGSECQPDYTVLTAEFLADLRGEAPGPARESFLKRLRANAKELLERQPTEWQRAHEAKAKANRLNW